MKKLIFFFVFSLLCFKASAQQTIFAVPSADVAEPGQLVVMETAQFDFLSPNSFWNGAHSAMFGIGYNTEINTTLFNTSSPASNNVSLGVGFKTAIPILKNELPEEEIKLTIGEMIPVSLEGQGDTVGNWTYGHLSFRLPKVKTRITAGSNFGTKQIFGRNQISFLGGIEQPIPFVEKTKVITSANLIADYFSGTHGFGFLILGLNASTIGGISAFGGYQIPNNPRCGHAGLIAGISKSFKLF